MKKEKLKTLLAENENLVDAYKPNFLRTFMVNFLFLLLWVVVTIILFLKVSLPTDQGLEYALSAAVGVIMYASFSAVYLGGWLVAFCACLIWYLRESYILTDKRVIVKKGGKIYSLSLNDASIVLATNLLDKLFGLKTGGIYFCETINGEKKTKFVFKYVRKAKLIAEKFDELKSAVDA